MTTYLTRRLYYDDPYLRRFNARVLQWEEVEDHPAVVLDQTAFYPGGGGQPPDLGSINGVPVLDVRLREHGGGILHLLQDQVKSRNIVGTVDWNRRFDHMQQHTGQHILSAAFWELFRAETIGFHMGLETTTIDLNQKDLSEEKVDRAERLANHIITEDRKVMAHFLKPGEEDLLPLRKQPTVTGPIRVVEIEGFDVTPCGGTHVSRTGEVGIIKVVGVERRGDAMRVSFLCGWRAFDEYSHLQEIVSNVARYLTTGPDDIPGVVQKLKTDLQAAQKTLRRTKSQWMKELGLRLTENAKPLGPWRLVMYRLEEGIDPGVLSRVLAEHDNVVAVLGWTSGDKAQMILTRGSNVELDMSDVLRRVAKKFAGRGGGGSERAQGGFSDASILDDAMEYARDLISRDSMA